MIQVQRIHASNSSPRAYTSILDFFKSTLFGRFYLHYLRQYPLIRMAVIWSWKNLLTLTTVTYSKFKHSKFKQLSEIVDNRLLVYPKQTVSVRAPDIYPSEKSSSIKIPVVYEFPEIFIATITDAKVMGASNFVHTNQAITGHNLFRIGHDYTSEELHGRLYINAKKQLITRLSSIKTEVEIDCGILFTDAVSANYAHFITEVLPKVFVYTKTHPNKTIPLIVDCELHFNLMQALELVISDDAQLIGLGKGEPLHIKSLQVVSACGYVPFGRRPRSNHFEDHSHGVFSSSALLGMRDLIKSKISKLELNTSEVKVNKKIWIKRNSNYRNVSNANEIQDVLVSEGFTVVEPEKLSFIEQVTVFSNADVIVGATGAAFANLIFCNPETKVIILIAEFKHMIYGYWQNMAASVGNQVSYVLGANADKVSEVHSNFKVEITDLLKAISD